MNSSFDFELILAILFTCVGSTEAWAAIHYVPPVRDHVEINRGLSMDFRKACESDLQPAKIPTESELINFAKDAQLARGRFSDSYIEKSRSEGPKPNTDYYYTLDENGELSGLLAVTYSHYNNHKREQSPSTLPLEDYLKMHVDRPLHGEDGGVVAELRFFTTKKSSYVDSILSLKVWAFPDIYKKIRDYNPYFLSENIIYTYGDEFSIEHYKLKSFAPFAAEPKLVDNVIWSVLVTSPRRLLEYVQEVRQWFYRYNFGHPTQVTMPNGRPATFSRAVEFQFRRGKKILKEGLGLVGETEVAPGLWVADGGMVQWDGDQLVVVGPLSQPYALPYNPRIVAQEGHHLILRDGEKPGSVRVGKAFEVEPGILAQPGDLVDWNFFDGDWTSINQRIVNARLMPGRP